jgi:hypothetical protein
MGAGCAHTRPMMMADKINVVKTALSVRVDATAPSFFNPALPRGYAWEFPCSRQDVCMPAQSLRSLYIRCRTFVQLYPYSLDSRNKVFRRTLAPFSI